ncbi:cytochrome b5 domain-containing protein [Methanolobus chelungpuianus]|uniref:Cytochrome B5 n=1 Tax=Methanolobus chelungpuianus TaxID=502115 RepID=A0AAE3L281_9EURY|nr:cytochrome b5 domain-containing protein [Methanolobus chelungpuianus]MCQ6963443.1 cytochrome B5 [Methanolobus chelungpuianus]
MREFTREELSKYDGKKSKEIYVAYKGKVYDVTDSNTWFDGEHYEHEGGRELTEQMDDAPHAEEVFDDYKVIGELVD